MHVSKPPKIQNQTKNTKREPELEAPRTYLQIGHHVIEAETISQQGSALPEDSARYQLTYQRTINSLSADYQLTINSLSTHYQLTISSQMTARILTESACDAVRAPEAQLNNVDNSSNSASVQRVRSHSFTS